MTEVTTPKVGFVSLGCPKALTDSELILTQLSAEGYQTSKTFAGADLVIVNTCGFIDDAVKESLDTIGEALAENGKVIVTGCLGARQAEGGANLVMEMHPSVLAVTGPHATQEVMDAVHTHLPKPHEPFLDLLPPQGVKLTPKHYAYLKISIRNVAYFNICMASTCAGFNLVPSQGLSHDVVVWHAMKLIPKQSR